MAEALSLQALDRVLLKCGDRWREEQLRVSVAGSLAQPLTEVDLNVVAGRVVYRAPSMQRRPYGRLGA